MIFVFPWVRAFAGFLALLLLVCPLAMANAAPAGRAPPASDEVNLDYFKQRLTPLGQWIKHPLWGEAWKPSAGPDFRPYFYGYWDYSSDHGVLWVSSEPYGDIVYHYGRWLLDPRYGWIWLPGYVWGPSWVVWREAGDYIGWFAMPPGHQDFSTDTLASTNAASSLYGYRNIYGSGLAGDAFANTWVFVFNQDFGRSDRRPYVIDPVRLQGLYRISQERTRYIYDRIYDRIVDQAFDRERLEALTHRQFGENPAAYYLRRRAPILSVSQGREIFRRQNELNQAGLASLTEPLGEIGIGPGVAEPAALGLGIAPYGAANRLNGAGGNFLDEPGRGLGVRPRPGIGFWPGINPGTDGFGAGPAGAIANPPNVRGGARNPARIDALGPETGGQGRTDSVMPANAPAMSPGAPIGAYGPRARRIYPYTDNILSPRPNAVPGMLPETGSNAGADNATATGGIPAGFPRTRSMPAFPAPAASQVAPAPVTQPSPQAVPGPGGTRPGLARFGMGGGLP